MLDRNRAAAYATMITRIGLRFTYAGTARPAPLIIGVGPGIVMAPVISTATFGVPAADAGVASAGDRQRMVAGYLLKAALGYSAVKTSLAFLP